jgi:hypothetical protein
MAFTVLKTIAKSTMPQQLPNALCCNLQMSFMAKNNRKKKKKNHLLAQIYFSKPLKLETFSLA